MTNDASNNYQCKGMTLKGVQCQKIAKSGYCNYHINQSTIKIDIPLDYNQKVKITTIKTTKTSSAIEKKTSTAIKVSTRPKINSSHSRTRPTKITELKPIIKPGFIYIYTLTHLIHAEPQKMDWLYFKDLPYGSSNQSKNCKWKVFNPKNTILVKIGMTTQSVYKRLKQWENQCHHQLTVLNPYIHQYKKKSIQEFFDKLSISNKNNFASYRDIDGGFSCNTSVNIAEFEIHKILKEVYGIGTVFCKGCSDLQTNDIDKFNVHVEWFIIPRKDLVSVYKIIDKVCTKYFAG